MKKLFVTVAAALLAGAALAQMPDVKIENHQGDVINTSSLVNGKPTILSFWSTTCKPCLMELNTINDQLMDWLDEADFQVVAVSIDDTRSAAKAKALASGNGWRPSSKSWRQPQHSARSWPPAKVFSTTSAIKP